jgi:hypothetical protein
LGSESLGKEPVSAWKTASSPTSDVTNLVASCKVVVVVVDADIVRELQHLCQMYKLRIVIVRPLPIAA